MNYLTLSGPIDHNLAENLAGFESMNYDSMWVVCDTTNGPINLQLPSIQSDLITKFGYNLIISDGSGSTDINPITIFTANGEKCEQNQNQFVISKPYQKIRALIASKTSWIILKDSNSRNYNVTLQGLINGINATFTTPTDFIPENLKVYRNGLSQIILSDYQISGSNTIIFNSSIKIGEKLTCDY